MSLLKWLNNRALELNLKQFYFWNFKKIWLKCKF